MNYIEYVLNRRISELRILEANLIQHSKNLIIEGKFEDYDINDFAIDFSDFESRIDELEKLKKGLGLVTVSEMEEEMIKEEEQQVA